ncbi:hypothetical protein LCGC14_0797770 [marine sediment metagenome]|uniref:Thioredoxin-like fold domain-containing protein n=1 Tax=marine sediment metagenome TaxID=412755 RepID=A0A0F9SAI8_9ZZZZ
MSDNDEFIMIVGQGCPACAAAKEGLSERIDSGQIKVMDVVNSKEALDLANRYNINGIPSIIMKDKSSNIGEVCELRQDLSGIVCKNKEVDF